MNRRFVGLLALAVLFGPASCLDDVGPPEFTTKNRCYGAENRPCDCPGSEQGLEICTSDGFFGDCACPGCTAYPDCLECGNNCFESCMCNSGRRFEEACRETCAQNGSEDAGESDSGDAAVCRVDDCGAPPAGRDTRACCSSAIACGFTLPQGGDCVAAPLEGELDDRCDPSEVLGFPAEGCCNADGNCGVLDEELYGCLDPSLFNGGQPVPCDIPR